MPDDLFSRCAAAVRLAEAAELGCDPSAFATNALTVVEAPSVAPPSGRWAALAVTFGTGSVLRVEPGVAAWVREHAPNKHFRVLQPFFLADLAAATTTFSGGRPCSAHGLTLGFVPERLVEPSPLPPGYELRWLGRGELAPLRQLQRFENTLGDPDEPERLDAALGGFAVFSPWGQPVALAGAWDEGHGRYEIGVDVVREFRGLGLAAPAAAAMTRWILEQGKTPIYTCGATNIRSQRVALSLGYKPLWTLGAVWRIPEGDSPYRG
ncbi:MAG: GNAT family N-acetyltransferase [Dehalococcoidia bacterium]